SGPALVRMLARLSTTDVSEPAQSLSDRLGHWLGWSDAIALGAALGGSSPGLPQVLDDLDEGAEYARVRNALTDAINGVNVPVASRLRSRRSNTAPRQTGSMVTVEFSTYRQRYVSLQQTMEARCT